MSEQALVVRYKEYSGENSGSRLLCWPPPNEENSAVSNSTPSTEISEDVSHSLLLMLFSDTANSARASSRGGSGQFTGAQCVGRIRVDSENRDWYPS